MSDRIQISEQQIEQFTMAISGFDETRDYLGLSMAYKTPEEIAKAFMEGYTTTDKGRLKCYKGYQMERDLVGRLKKIYPHSISTENTIVTSGALIPERPELEAQGHPDYWFEGYPGEIKSVLKDDWLPTERVPPKDYWQLQAYMLYSGKSKGVIVYESRESGRIRVKIFNTETRTQRSIREKYLEAAYIIHEKTNDQ